MGKLGAVIWMALGAAIMWLFLDAYPQYRPHPQQTAQVQDSENNRVVGASPAASVPPAGKPTSSAPGSILPPVQPTYSDKTEEVFPLTGSIINYTTQVNQQTASFTVINEKEGKSNCVVKLEDWATQAPVVELFVRAREQGTTRTVPLGEYRVKVACGQRWFGRDNMFGQGTRYTVGADPIKFWKDGNSTIGHTLNLTETFDGNLKMIDPAVGRF